MLWNESIVKEFLKPNFNSTLHYLRSQKENLGVAPLWVHCKAGVGRTGTIAVALALVEGEIPKLAA